LVAGEVQIPVEDGVLPGYCARPEGAGPFPVVLVIEEIFGVHEYIKDVCRRLAHLGYVAVAPELYARLGDLAHMTDFRKIIDDVISKAPDALMMRDLDHAAAFAATQGGDLNRLGVTGFCHGGRQTWLYAAHNPRLRAAVAWYGPLGGQATPIQPKAAVELAGDIYCPLLALYGGKDKSITDDQRAAAMAAAEGAGKYVQMKIYPDAEHGFHADYRPSYNEAAAKDGWARMLAFFRANGVT
jgi:carboxymethylenebutenolidase